MKGINHPKVTRWFTGGLIVLSVRRYVNSFRNFFAQRWTGAGAQAGGRTTSPSDQLRRTSSKPRTRPFPDNYSRPATSPLGQRRQREGERQREREPKGEWGRSPGTSRENAGGNRHSDKRGSTAHSRTQVPALT